MPAIFIPEHIVIFQHHILTDDANKCWAFDGSNWYELPDSTLRHCFRDTQSLIAGQDLWVTGLQQTSDLHCSDDEWTSELFNGVEWVPGPAHPTGDYSWSPCIVHLNYTHSLYTGGYPSVNDTWLYNWRSAVWTPTGQLNTGRYEHGCALIEDQKVMVAGGIYDGNYQFSAEVYDPVAGMKF